MPYLMSDVAAGSSAALQLQKNMAAAPYVQQETAAAAETTQLKLQEDRLKAAYAPQEAALKLQQDQANADKAKLSNIVTETGIRVTKEKSDAVKKLEATADWTTKDPSEKAMAIAAVWDEVDAESAEKMRTASANYDAKKLSNEIKQHEVNRQLISDFHASVKGASPEQIPEILNRASEGTHKLIESKIPGFFKETDPKLQQAQLEQLALNAQEQNGQATNETRKLVAEMQDGWHKEHDKTMLLIAELNRNGGGSSAGKESALELRQWNSAQRAWSRVDTEYKKPVLEAASAYKEASRKALDYRFWQSDSDVKAADKAWFELQSVKKERAQKKLDAIEGMPEGKEKDKLFVGLTKELESYDTEQPPPPPPPKKEVGAAAPPAKAGSSMLDLLPGGAKPSDAATSNKYTQDNPAKPTSKAEYDKLPPGSYYEQDGAIKRKKG
jgi:hypothetical protein